MTTGFLENFLSKLEKVRQRGSRWAACCPAHADSTPSLSVSEGEKAILLKCWSGCTLQEICQALGIDQRDLFFDALETNPERRRAAAEDRDRRQRARERHAEQQGALIDALRETDYFVRSRRGLDISTWTAAQLDDELNTLADAYRILESEPFYGS